jgi:MATE family, multidrug efflux pump
VRDGGRNSVRAVGAAVPAAVTPGPYRRIWRIAWPVSITTSTVTLITLVNLFWIGHLGTVAVAAVSICSQILFIVFGLSNIVHTGALAIVARRVGEGDGGRAVDASLHGVCLGALLGLTVGAAGYASAPAVLGFFDTGREVEMLALSYLRIMYLGQLPLFVSAALGACYQASGDARTPMLVNVAMVAANGIADPFFIFRPGEVTVAGVPLGWLGWGVDGAAAAAVLLGAVGCVSFVALSALSGRPFPWPTDRRIALAARDFLHMTRIGTPASASMIARPLSTFLLLKLIASFGTPAIAAFGIAMRSFSVNWIPYSGLNIAIASLVGQSLGAHNPVEARRVVRRGLAVTTWLGVFFCLLYYSCARSIILAFDHEPAVVEAGEWFLKLIALSFLFSGPMLPLGSAMNGAGDTKPPMLVAFLANWPVKLPLCYVLALPLGHGIEGVWMGMFLSIVFESLVMFAWYRRGTWLRRSV